MTDDRGTKVRLCGLPSESSRAYEAIPKEIGRRIESRLRPRLAVINSLCVVFVITVVVTFEIVMLGHMQTISSVRISGWRVPPITWLIVLTIALVAFISLVRSWVITNAMARRVVAAFLAERRCPACGYDLTGAALDADGCTVCPECGAAWRTGPSP